MNFSHSALEFLKSRTIREVCASISSMSQTRTMSRRFWPVLLAVAALFCLLFGCGGGSGGSSSGTTTGTVVQIALVGVYQGTRAPAQLAPLSTGSKIQFELLGVNNLTGNPQTVPASGYSTNAPSSVATLSSGGLLTATGNSNGTEYQVSATYAGTAYSQEFAVGPPEALLQGLIRTGTGSPVPGATINFTDASGAITGTTTSGTDGSFIANVPASSKYFAVVFNTSFYNVYTYGSSTYTNSISGCAAPLPTLRTGSLTTLPSNVIAYIADSSDPPPPPDGCG